MDALTVAFTKRSHIQYLNNLHARGQEDKKGNEIYGIEKKETTVIIDETGNKKRKFNIPIPNFREEAKKHLEHVLISCKAKNKVVTRNINKFKTGRGEKKKIELTPRGQLHKETVYGRIKQYETKEEKISSKFDAEMIQRVASPEYRTALLNRLSENGNDPKKAFSGKNSVDKNPIYLDIEKTRKVPEKVKLAWLEDNYTIRKDITPENFKNEKSIEKIIDIKIRKILQARLSEFNGNAKEAFSNLDKNPIWLNAEKGILIKRVTISGVKVASALHSKKDHHGLLILKNGSEIPVDFISTGNNHHVAIYKDGDGNLQDMTVSFYEAVERANQGQPVIDKAFNQSLGWQFLFTMKQNEYFVFPSNDFDPAEIDLMNAANNKLISPNLFRVQKISARDFSFRHHLETSVEEIANMKDVAYKRIKSLSPLENIVKVRINHLGEIVKTGEY
jgi:CRISPR-associated endonuclease Csn1